VSALLGDPFKPTERMLRQFAGLWVVFFGGMAVWQALHHHRPVVGAVLGLLAITVGPIGLLWPALIRPIFLGWMALAFPIGWTISRVVLSLVFFGLFTPLAMLFRLQGRDELALRKSPDAVTYWRSKPLAADKTQYLRQF